ncbi:MAG TPA: efflux RND transporter periplasmic adaptor subunit [Verrucomicrobiae bacterium]
MNPSGTKEPAALPPAREPLASTSEAAVAAGAKLRHAAILAAVLIVIGAVAGLVPRWLHRTALRAETRELAIQTVSVVSPVPGKAAVGLTLPAEAKALVEAPIYARTSGYLKRYLVDIGAQVKAGDLLAEIDTPELNQELAQARAQLTQTEAALALARMTAARWADLVKTASVSEQEAAEKQADLELKAATVEAARANVRRLENLQSFERVTAPFAGTITARGTDVGQLVASISGKELFRLAQTGTLRVYVRVPQTTALGVAPGQMAELTIPELPGRVFPAKVVRTSGAMSADSRTLLTELEVDNSRGEILAGTYVQVRLTEAKLDPVLTLPSNTLLFRAEGTQVGVVGVGDKVELRRVTLGRDFGATIEVLGGVGLTDRVILNPADSLVGGTTVRVAEAAKEPAGKAASTAASAK